MSLTFSVSKKANLCFDIGDADDIKISSTPTKWQVCITNHVVDNSEMNEEVQPSIPTHLGAPKAVDYEIQTSLMMLNDAMESLDLPIPVQPIQQTTLHPYIKRNRKPAFRKHSEPKPVLHRRRSSGAAVEEVELEIKRMTTPAPQEETKPFKRSLWLRTPFRKNKTADAKPDNFSMKSSTFIMRF